MVAVRGVTTQPAGAATVATSPVMVPGPALRAVVTSVLVAPDCRPSGAVKVEVDGRLRRHGQRPSVVRAP